MGGKFVRYTVVGTIGVSIHLFVLYLGMLLSYPVSGYAAGFCLANFWAFYVNSMFTFDANRTIQSFVKYFVIVFVSLALSTLMFASLKSFSNILAILVSLPFGIIFQFCGHNYFTFRPMKNL